MADSDRNETSFADVDLTLTIHGGDAVTEYCVVQLAQAGFSYTEETPPWSEVTHRNKHLSTPAARNTGSGKVTGSISAKVSSFKGSSAASLKEVMTGTGLAASWSSVGNGNRKMVKVVAVVDDGDLSQTITFNYCIFSNVQVNTNGENGLTTITADFTDLEDSATVA